LCTINDDLIEISKKELRNNCDSDTTCLENARKHCDSDRDCFGIAWNERIKSAGLKLCRSKKIQNKDDGWRTILKEGQCSERTAKALNQKQMELCQIADCKKENAITLCPDQCNERTKEALDQTKIELCKIADCTKENAIKLCPGQCKDQCHTTKCKTIPSSKSLREKEVCEKCQFPFTYKGTTYHKCTNKDEGGFWCSTKTFANGDHVTGFWGYCQDNCYKGCRNEIPSTCSFSVGVTCSRLATYGYCKYAWNSFSENGIAICPSTGGLVKDYCKIDCGNCYEQ